MVVDNLLLICELKRVTKLYGEAQSVPLDILNNIGRPTGENGVCLVAGS